MIKNSVGNTLDNNPLDVIKVRQVFDNIGFLKDEEKETDYQGKPLGYITRHLDTAIKRFQKENDLREDGLIFAGGETELQFIAKTQEKNPKEKPPFIFVPEQQEGEINSPIGLYGGVKINKDAVIKSLQDHALSVAEEKTQNTITPEPKRKPEIISPTKKGDELLDFIGRFESSDNYNIIVGGEEKPLTKMTVKEVLDLQKKLGENKKNTALGRYQIKNSTLKETINKLSVDQDTLFDKKLQDQLARKLLEKRGFEKFKAGKMSAEEFIKELSKEWAALPTDESNDSYHKGVGNNKSLIDFKTIKELLEKD